MPLPDVCIAPYEAGGLAPDEPLCAPAAYRVWVWSLRCGGYYLVRAVKTYNGFRVLVACRQTRDHSPLIQLQRDEQDRMSATIRKGRFYRVLYFDTEGRLASSRDDWEVTLLVSSPGCPNWRTRWDSSRFKWGVAKPKEYLSPRWRVTTPAAQIEYEVGEMLADPASDCAFSWRWAHLSKREKICLLFDTNAKVLDECEVILRSALWTDSTWKNVPDCQWFIRFRPDRTSPSLTVNMGSGALSGEILSNDTSFSLSSRLFQWLELVVRFYDLHFATQPSDKTAMGNYGVTYWRIYAPIPTQHELLEAQLHLREWLQDKVAPEEIPFLLGDAT